MSDTAFADAPQSADHLPFTDAPPAAIERPATRKTTRATAQKPPAEPAAETAGTEQAESPNATQYCALLAAADKDFIANNPEPTTDEAVGSFLARRTAPAPATAGPDDFNWSGDDVMIPEQPTTAVYWNPRGQVVIRQEAAWNEADDPYVFFSPYNLPVLIAKLQAEYDSWKS